MLASLYEDCRWHQQWSRALIRFAIEQHPENRSVVEAWINKWVPLGENSIRPLILRMADVLEKSNVKACITNDFNEHLIQAGLSSHQQAMSL